MKSRVRIVSAVVATSSALLLAAACGGRTDGSYSGAVGQSPEAMCRAACNAVSDCKGDQCSRDYECDDYGNCAPGESTACVDDCAAECEVRYRETLEDYPSCVDEMQAVIACVTGGECRDCETEGDRHSECLEQLGFGEGVDYDDSVSIDAPQDRFGAFSRLLR